MRVVQLTDLHIDEEGYNPFEIDVRANFLKLLDEALATKPQHLVLTGDLSNRDGGVEIYEWLFDHLQQQPIPYDIIPGNHDHSVSLAETFQRTQLLTENELFFAKKIGKQSCIFLDSAVGKHSFKQLKWLERQLRQAGSPVIIFMHHPPTLAGVPFMDNKHALQDIEAIQKVLCEHPHSVTVFCGHYHVEKTIQFKNVVVHITPSAFFQIDQRSEDFKVDHHRIALRVIDLVNDSIHSSVYYYEGARKHNP